MSIMLKME